MEEKEKQQEIVGVFGKTGGTWHLNQRHMTFTGNLWDSDSLPSWHRRLLAPDFDKEPACEPSLAPEWA